MSDLLIIYVAAGIVVALLIVFVALSVRMVAQKVSSGIRHRASELLSTYDEILEKKSQELKRLNGIVIRKKDELRRLEDRVRGMETTDPGTEDAASDPSYVLNVAEKMGNAAYQDGRIGGVYQKIRAAFSHDPLDVIRDLVPDVGEKGPATVLLEQLSFDTVYELSALAESEQLEALESALDESGRQLLADYLAGHRSFKAIAFYDYLKARALSEPQPVVLRIPSSFKVGWLPSGIVIQIDDDICEGFQLEANNQLYDYCVRKSEIS